MTAPPIVSHAHARPEWRTRVRLIPALGAGVCAGLVMLALYYATLALLPVATSYPLTRFPLAEWAHRIDMAQVIGTIADPPYPTPRTWLFGLALWGGTLAACGIAYAVALAWAVQKSDTAKGTGFGIALFAALALLLSLAQGMHPAIMRNALPDAGVLLLGWSGWATVQMLACFITYGATLGALYRRWT